MQPCGAVLFRKDVEEIRLETLRVTEEVKWMQLPSRRAVLDWNRLDLMERWV
jgi:hypothetical protein